MEAITVKPGERTKGTQLVVRTTRDELAAVHAAAAQQGRTASQLVRQALRAQGVPLAP